MSNIRTLVQQRTDDVRRYLPKSWYSYIFFENECNSSAVALRKEKFEKSRTILQVGFKT